MIKKAGLFLVVFLVMFSSRVYAPSGSVAPSRARHIKADTTNFGGKLSSADTTVQKIADTLDEGITPNSTSLPGTCTIGMQYMDTDATSGQRFYLCESTDTWVLQGDGAGGGSAIIFDIGDDGGNDSLDVKEIATTGDTNNIFTEPTADKILIDVGINWPTADAVTNATFTTALTVDTGTVTLTGNGANNSVLTIGAGAVSVSGSNTGDNSGTDDQTLAEVLAEGALADVDIQLGETDIKLDAVLSGDATWSGIVIAGTSGVTTLAVGDLCYLNNDDSRYEKTDANLSDGYDKQLGICVLAAADGAATEMLTYGKIRSAAFPVFTVGAPVYMSETLGEVTQTAPTTTDSATRIIGIAITAEDLLFNPSNDYYTHI